MSFTADQLLHRLADLHGGNPVNRYLVAFSGGLDSTVLLHALAGSGDVHGMPLVAVHVNHGLQVAADDWEAHCRRFADSLGVLFVSRRIAVAADDERGPEGAARAGRYAAMAELMEPGDAVLSAHHEDDQAETLLLNLLRGSGAGGLAGIGAVQPFGRGWLLRPMLDVSKSDIEQYAARKSLEWVEDPSNAGTQFDRNFLRREVMPVLMRRWPAAVSRLAHSAQLAAETHALQTELADIDLAACGDAARLDINVLRGLTPARQRNVLRRAIALGGLPPAPSRQLFEAIRTLIPARPDAGPLIQWPGGELRRYRERLFVLAPVDTTQPEVPNRLHADGLSVSLGMDLGALRLVPDAAGGIAPHCAIDGLDVRFRTGGERLRPHGRRETQRLKNLMQAAGVLPWRRAQIPLLFAGDTLLAVADLWVADEAWSMPGLSVHWENAPIPLFARGRSANL